MPLSSTSSEMSDKHRILLLLGLVTGGVDSDMITLAMYGFVSTVGAGWTVTYWSLITLAICR